MLENPDKKEDYNNELEGENALYLTGSTRLLIPISANQIEQSYSVGIIIDE